MTPTTEVARIKEEGRVSRFALRVNCGPRSASQ